MDTHLRIKPRSNHYCWRYGLERASQYNRINWHLVDNADIAKSDLGGSQIPEFGFSTAKTKGPE